MKWWDNQHNNIDKGWDIMSHKHSTKWASRPISSLRHQLAIPRLIPPWSEDRSCWTLQPQRRKLHCCEKSLRSSETKLGGCRPRTGLSGTWNLSWSCFDNFFHMRCRAKMDCLRIWKLSRVKWLLICATEEGSAEASNPNAEQLLGPELSHWNNGDVIWKDTTGCRKFLRKGLENLRITVQYSYLAKKFI